MADAPRARRVLVLGGARSGKSAFAEGLASSIGLPVVYVATGEAIDDEMAGRIRRHRARRPEGWATVEAPRDIPSALARTEPSAVTWLIDSVTLLVAGAMSRAPAAGASDKTGDPVEGSL